MDILPHLLNNFQAVTISLHCAFYIIKPLHLFSVTILPWLVPRTYPVQRGTVALPDFTVYHYVALLTHLLLKQRSDKPLRAILLLNTYPGYTPMHILKLESSPNIQIKCITLRYHTCNPISSQALSGQHRDCILALATQLTNFVSKPRVSLSCPITQLKSLCVAFEGNGPAYLVLYVLLEDKGITPKMAE